MEGGLRGGLKRVLTEGIALVHSAHVLCRDEGQKWLLEHVFSISECINVRSSDVIMVLKIETFPMTEMWCPHSREGQQMFSGHWMAVHSVGDI